MWIVELCYITKLETRAADWYTTHFTTVHRAGDMGCEREILYGNKKKKTQKIGMQHIKPETK